jgi:hypothetical protein
MIPSMVDRKRGRWWRRQRAREAPRDARPHELDAVYTELMETVWAEERAARREDRIDAIVRYANPAYKRDW